MDHPIPTAEPSNAPDRRTVLKVLASGLAVPLLPACDPGPRTDSSVTSDARLSEQQLGLIAEIADTLIPATETPGARDAGVASFIERIVLEWMPEQARQHFLDELEDFDHGARRREGASFVDLDIEARTSLLERAQEKKQYLFIGRGFSPNPATLHRQTFFHLMKWLTLVGYYTSEIGMKQELSYRKVSGRYIPSFSLDSTSSGEQG